MSLIVAKNNHNSFRFHAVKLRIHCWPDTEMSLNVNGTPIPDMLKYEKVHTNISEYYIHLNINCR